MEEKICKEEMKENQEKLMEEESLTKEKKLCDKIKEKLLHKLEVIFEQLISSKYYEYLSFEKITSLMYEPTDAASLGVARAFFGLCMVIDTIDERGFSNIDLKWGNPEDCHFPLIHGLRPLALPWMVILYTIMWLGAFGIMLGLYFKIACALFVIPYWYVFILDKSFWNNHSYLYGIVALLFWGTSANKYFSLDAKLSKKKEESVPYWNYFILKFQFFTLYFIAGLKKSSWEWLEGYAMTNLSRHWVFDPFTMVLSPEQVDYYIVHWFAFVFDLSVGFFMLFDVTRMPAMFFCTFFHLMNSRLFAIGMFPYVCLATMPLFCRVDWPRKLVFRNFNAREEEEKSTVDTNCCSKRNFDLANNAREGNNEKKVKKQQRTSKKQKFVVAALLFHMALQFFLPYSHFITKGYNNWVPGLYGYSWDMMVHAWDIELVVIKVTDNESGKDHFLDPGVWTHTDRWARHGDMLYQYAHCIEDNLLLKNGPSCTTDYPWTDLSSNFSIYIDVWCSLNGRFQQRLFNPNVDLLKAEWHPFKPVPYLMPLLRQFSSYRTELDRITEDVYSWSNYTDVIFVADFPGMHLENYAENDLMNVTLTVLEGEVTYFTDNEDDFYEKWNKRGRTIGKGSSIKIETGRFHKVETTSPHPACYMYTFANRTKQQLADQGITEPVRKKEPFPILKEIGSKINQFGHSLAHIVNVVLHLVFDFPMIQRYLITN